MFKAISTIVLGVGLLVGRSDERAVDASIPAGIGRGAPAGSQVECWRIPSGYRVRDDKWRAYFEAKMLSSSSIRCLIVTKLIWWRLRRLLQSDHLVSGEPFRSLDCFQRGLWVLGRGNQSKAFLRQTAGAVQTSQGSVKGVSFPSSMLFWVVGLRHAATRGV